MSFFSNAVGGGGDPFSSGINMQNPLGGITPGGVGNFNSLFGGMSNLGGPNWMNDLKNQATFQPYSVSQYTGDPNQITNAVGSTPQIDMSQQAQFRGDQLGLAQQLQAQSQGQGPSLANLQLQQALNQSQSQAMGMAASQRGVNPAIAARNAQMSMGQNQQAAAMQSAQTRMQEQMNAQGQLGNVLNQGRGGDISLASNQADLQAKQNALNVQANTSAQQLQEQQWGQQNAINMQARQGNSAIGAAGLGGLGSMMSSMFSSDKNMKKDIEPADGKAKEFLDALSSYMFRYKGESEDTDKHAGVMAQDLEKSEVGKNMVVDTPKGKMVDFAKGLPAMLASMTMLNDRISDMEKALKMKHGKGK